MIARTIKYVSNNKRYRDQITISDQTKVLRHYIAMIEEKTSKDELDIINQVTK